MKLISVLAVVVLIFSECEKRPFDYRNKYCGDYDFVYKSVAWTVSQGTQPREEGTYSGRVTYDKNGDPDHVTMDFMNEKLTFAIDREGNASSCGIEGEFKKKRSLTIHYVSNACPGGGLGGGVNYTITGVRK